MTLFIFFISNLLITGCCSKPQVEISTLPLTAPVGNEIAVSVNITGEYDRVVFQTDNGEIGNDFVETVGKWIPRADGLGTVKADVFFCNEDKPISVVGTVQIEKIPEPVCPSIEVTQPLSNSFVTHNLAVAGTNEGLAEGTTLRIATIPHSTNKLHPQDGIPTGTLWTTPIYIGTNDSSSNGNVFDIVILAVNSVGNQNIENYLSEAKQTGIFSGINSIKGSIECFRISDLTKE